ncbi:hypothetical protein ACMGDH_12190 [Sphingomonas sp. DT-207]|uniref:hypothetical protein n=1 Tax=Sphingomonas sp. DT-207 TaxID=3396167 RepID=UPI003F1BC0F7
MLLVAAGCIALALFRAPPAALDISVTQSGAWALLRIGFASIRIAFDSGQECSKSDRCTAPLLPPSLADALPEPAGTAVATS